MSIAQFNSLYATGTAALDAGDYAGAILAAMKAQFLLPLTPNVLRDLGRGSSQSITWATPEGLEMWIANVRKLQNQASVASGGVFAQSRVTYARPTG